MSLANRMARPWPVGMARPWLVGMASAAIASAALTSGVVLAPAALAAPGDVTVTVDVPAVGGFALLYTDIASGPDGNLWTTNVGSNSISRIATTGGLATTFNTPSAGSPTGIVAGPDGAMWFGYGTLPKVGRIAMDGSITEFPVPSGTGVLDVAIGPDGNLWYTSAGNQKIGRMTMTGAATEFPTGGLNANFITGGPDGSNRVYVSFSGSPKIGIVNTSGTVTTLNLPAGVTQAFYIRTVKDDVWLIESKAGGFSLGKLIADTTFSETVLPAANPTNIVPAEGGAFWVLDFAGSKVLQMTSAGALQNTFALPVQSIAGTMGQDGNLWTRGSAKVLRVLTGQVPVLQTAPAVAPATGVVVGNALTASNGSWKYLPSSYAYQWQRCTTADPSTCTDIAGATAAGYTAAATDNAAYVRAGVSAVNSNGASPLAYSAAVAVGSATPPGPPAPPAPATGPDVAIGSGVVAELDAPYSVRRNARGSFDVSFTALDVAGKVTFTFTKGSKKKIIANVPVKNGAAVTSWKIPRSWPKGTTAVKATFTPSAGSPYTAGNMKTTFRVR